MRQHQEQDLSRRLLDAACVAHQRGRVPSTSGEGVKGLSVRSTVFNLLRPPLPHLGVRECLCECCAPCIARHCASACLARVLLPPSRSDARVAPIQCRALRPQPRAKGALRCAALARVFAAQTEGDLARPSAVSPQALLSRDPGAPHAQRPGGGCEFDAALERFLGSGQFYVPSLPSPRGARDALRTAFRAAPGGGDLDAGFQAIRALQARHG